jgi:hypothetical protein
MGTKLNPRFDRALARGRLERLGIPLDRRVATLSGGQRAQVALALALAKGRELLLLDEPLAALDPLARREFLQPAHRRLGRPGRDLQRQGQQARRQDLRKLQPDRLPPAAHHPGAARHRPVPGRVQRRRPQPPAVPPRRPFWLFQSIETALFVALAGLLLLAAIHLVRRRIS